MHQVKYFSELYCDIETVMNEWLIENKSKVILKVHINKESLVSGEICVNGYIHYE